MQPCSSKECRITEDQSGGLKKEMVLLDPGTHSYESTLICKMIFSRSAILTNSSFAALWATRLHSTSIERSDSYLLGFSLKIGMTALFMYFISAQRCVIYLTLRGHRGNQTAWPFLGFWRGFGLLISISNFESAGTCCVYLLCKKNQPF